MSAYSFTQTLLPPYVLHIFRPREAKYAELVYNIVLTSYFFFSEKDKSSESNGQTKFYLFMQFRRKGKLVLEGV